MRDLPDLSFLAVPGSVVAVRVTPKSSRDRILAEPGLIRVYVTAPREGGKATAAVQHLLARALGVPKTRLSLVRGLTARDKAFRID